MLTIFTTWMVWAVPCCRTLVAHFVAMPLRSGTECVVVCKTNKTAGTQYSSIPLSMRLGPSQVLPCRVRGTGHLGCSVAMIHCPRSVTLPPSSFLFFTSWPPLADRAPLGRTRVPKNGPSYASRSSWLEGASVCERVRVRVRVRESKRE